MASKTVEPIIRRLVKPSFKSGESDELRRNIDFGDYDAQEFDETRSEFEQKWNESKDALQQPHFKKNRNSPLIKTKEITRDFDPSYKDWDEALDYYLNTIEPDLFDDGTGTIFDGVKYDVEQNYGGNIFENLPRGYKMGNQLEEYVKNKIKELVNSKYQYLSKYL